VVFINVINIIIVILHRATRYWTHLVGVKGQQWTPWIWLHLRLTPSLFILV